ncbi:MAG TPA: hypothetical protein VMW37_04795 [Dehalococcoidales bacterium]|nr:hypothetical protein [Dehalococcoidales bacterium]
MAENTMATVHEIKDYVDRKLEKTGSDNIAIHLPAMTPVMLRALQKHYKDVRLQPFGYVRFEIEKSETITKAAPENPDPDKALYFGEKEKLALSTIGSVAEVPKVGVEGGVIKPIRYQKTPVDEAIFKVIDVGRPETRNTLFHTINNQPLRAQEIYTYTQQTLKAKYPTGKVTLYRFPRAIEEQKIASWSTSPKFFTKEMQPSLISKEFDITDIFAHPDTYPLLKERGEGEVLVMLQKPSSLTIPQVPKAVPKHIDEAIWNAMPGYRQAEVAKAARQVPRSGKLYWRELTQSERDAISQIEEHYAT